MDFHASAPDAESTSFKLVIVQFLSLFFELILFISAGNLMIISAWFYLLVMI